MHFFKTYLIIVLTIFLSQKGYSQQEKYADSILFMLEEGDKMYSKNHYEKAVDIYQQVAIDLENDPLIDKRIGVSLFKLERYVEALPILQDLKANSDTIDIYIDYFLALSHHKLGDYEKALNMYESCLLYIEDNSVSSGKEDIERQIEQCKFWIDISASELDVKITRLDSNINSTYPEYGAMYSHADSNMYFTSRRKSPKVISNIIQRADEDVFTSKFENGMWQKAGKANTLINSGSNNAIVGISSDGESIYLYNDVNLGDIMVSQINNKDSIPEFLQGDINTPSSTESSITFNGSGDVCYFISNRTDIQNYGGKDIYMASLDSGIYWRNIKNLGAVVNSKSDEDFVFWSDEDTALYFSSNREYSIGGYDIFVCKTNADGSLTAPRNIGLPINTPFDDISFFKSGNLAWYSSTYEDSKEDIFEIDFNYGAYNPEWNKMSIHGLQRIDEFNVVENVFFDIGKKNVYANDPVIMNIIDVLKNTKDAKITLSGYSDWTGNKSKNDKLAFKRAINLANILVDNQVAPKMLTIESFGQCEALAGKFSSNDSLFFRALSLNRRVQLTIEKQGSPYLFVKEPEDIGWFQDTLNLNSCPQFAVMVYISDHSDKLYNSVKNIEEHYSKKDNLFYYQSESFSSIIEADKRLEELEKQHKNAYIFCEIK